MQQQPKYFTLVTGATAGIGKQIAIECAKRKLNVFLVALPESGINDFADELKTEYQTEVYSHAVDLTKYDAPQQVFDFAQSNNIIVDKLINNAGVGFNGNFDSVTAELTDKMILLNIRASTLLMLYFLPQMKKLKKAHILNISSFAAFSPVPLKSVYAATKTYLFFLTRSLNKELKGTGVKVTSIYPTGVTSDRTKELIQKTSFMSRISTLSPEKVAQIAVKNMLNGKKFVVPGLTSKIYYYFGSILPHGLVLRLAGSVFRKNS